jgi:hypothetical protein
MVGTPLTHERFLRRHRGTYGPAISARSGTWPGNSTPLPGLSVCGDSCMPGIGVPAAAASGMMVGGAMPEQGLCSAAYVRLRGAPDRTCRCAVEGLTGILVSQNFGCRPA